MCAIWKLISDFPRLQGLLSETAKWKCCTNRRLISIFSRRRIHLILTFRADGQSLSTLKISPSRTCTSFVWGNELWTYSSCRNTLTALITTVTQRENEKMSQETNGSSDEMVKRMQVKRFERKKSGKDRFSTQEKVKSHRHLDVYGVQ